MTYEEWQDWRDGLKFAEEEAERKLRSVTNPPLVQQPFANLAEMLVRDGA